MTTGLIGLGNMGLPIAERLLDAGYPLVVYNRTPEKARPLVDRGAVLVGSAGEILREADVCFTSLADDRALEEVAAQVLAGARRDTVLVDLSTVSPEASARVARAADGAGVLYLRAPVSGNPTVVRAGNLTLIVSGPRAALERVDDVLRAIGPNVYYLRDGEGARVVKLAINLMIAGIAQLMSEALVLGEAAGVDRRELLEVMGNSAAGAPFVKYKTEPLLRDDFSATFTTQLMEKDLDLIRDVARDSGLSLPLADVLKPLLHDAVAAGYGDKDFMALFLHLREASGLETRAEPAPQVAV